MRAGHPLLRFGAPTGRIINLINLRCICLTKLRVERPQPSRSQIGPRSRNARALSTILVVNIHFLPWGGFSLLYGLCGMRKDRAG